jgi:hypothetical protein
LSVFFFFFLCAAIHRDVDLLTEQVKNLGEAEVERRMNSTTTTIKRLLVRGQYLNDGAQRNARVEERSDASTRVDTGRLHFTSRSGEWTREPSCGPF